ncbi:MAG: hypothetical protein QM705_06385 [Ancrocorticia sp.]
MSLLENSFEISIGLYVVHRPMLIPELSFGEGKFGGSLQIFSTW